MNNRHNIWWHQGFTLLEMIIVMILSGIVVSIVYLVLTNVSNEWKHFYSNRSKMTAVVLLKNTLMHDLDRAEYVYCESESVYGFAGKNDTLFYQFGTAVTRAHAGFTDTFPVSVENLSHHYVDYLEESNIVSDIRFDLKQPVVMSDVVIRKEYTSAVLMQLYTREIRNSVWTYER